MYLKRFFTRTLLPLWLALAILFTPAYAASTDSNYPPASYRSQTVVETVYDGLAVEPRFEYISRIAASLSISDWGYADCAGSYTTYEELDGTIKIELQQYKDNRWIYVYDWSEDYSGSGAKLLSKGRFVVSGYRYRAIVTVQIKDSKGNVLETIACDSPVWDYNS